MAAPQSRAPLPLSLRLPLVTITLGLFFLMLLVAPLIAAPYGNDKLAAEAARYDTLLRQTHRKQGKNPGALMRQGYQSFARKQHRDAINRFAGAYIEGGGAPALLALSETLLAATARQYRERYILPEQASSAAYLAYQKSGDVAGRADALATLSRALERRHRWRDVLNALSASLNLREDAAQRSRYDELYKKHGFRVTNYTVDSDSAAPRLCVTFSEKLKSGAAYEDYVRMAGREQPAVSSSNQQLCIEGLTHGERYKIRLRAGLPAEIDDKLRKNAELTVYVKDRSPSVRLPGNKYVLPRTGQTGIPVTSVNTDKVHIQIFRVGDRSLASAIDGEFLKQLSGYSVNELKERLGQKVWNGQLDVRKSLNKDIVTAFPVDKAVPELEPGVYAMVAEAEKRPQDDWKQKATQWFIVSDLGLAAMSGDDGLNVFVRSLTSADPVSGVEVRLVARNNEVLARASSDGGGFISFKAGLTRGEGGLSPALLIASSKAGDYAFLDLTSPAFDLSDRGVAGRKAPGPVDVMLYTERGVYKPGETVHLTGLARDNKAEALSDLPLTFRFIRPDGKTQHERLIKDQGLGGRSYAYTLDAGVATGTWRAVAYLDTKNKPVGETSFLVEDFVPERMDMIVSPQSEDGMTPGRAFPLSIEGKYLYGAPAKDHAIEGEVVLSAASSAPEGFKNYHFGLAGEKVKPRRQPLPAGIRTDDKGNARLAIDPPEAPESTRPLSAQINLRLRDPSGRTIERTLTRPYLTGQPLIGIRPLFDDLGEDSQAEFELAVMGPDGKQQAYRGLTWELVKLHTRYQWYSRDGRWNYQRIVSEERIRKGKIDALAERPVKVGASVEWGRYRLEVRDDDKGRPAASYAFSAGWHASAVSETPDMLDVALDKRDYEIGDTARLRIVSRMPGKALITVLNGGIRAMKTVSVPAGESTTPLTVDENWGAGAYVAVTLYRPMDVGNKRMPGRAIGLQWLNAGHKKRLLQVTLDTEVKIRPDGPLEVPVTVSGLAPGEEAYVAAAAVDVGILNLTGYKPPAPESYFLAQRKLSTEFRDLYGRLIDGMQGAAGAIRSGGDGAGANGGMSLSGNPPEQKPLSLFSGIVRVDENGKARLRFNIPPFNGAVKVMLTAWSKSRMGHAAKEVIVRDPVILMGTAPRFLKKGDRSRLFLTLHNVEGPGGDYQLQIDTGGLDTPITAARTLKLALARDQRHSLAIPLAPDQIGKAVVSASLSGPGGLTIHRDYAIEVKPPYPDITRQSVQNLASGARLILSKEVFTGFVEGTEKATLLVGPSSLPDVPGLLASLDRYPYGCSEQITSRALPLMYLSSVADQAGLPKEKEAELKETVQKAIDTLLTRQGNDGSFGLWSTGYGSTWLTAYVSEFLSRARERGYSVPERYMTQALDKLANTVGYASDFSKGGEDIAYSLYVLARNKRARLGELRYYVDEKLSNFATPMAKVQLATALALYGDRERAARAYNAAMRDLGADGGRKGQRYSSDYGSQVRDGAAALALASENGMGAQVMPAVVRLFEDDGAATDTLSTTTQEKAWLLLAANAMFEEAKTYRMDVDGARHTGVLSRMLRLATLQTPLNVTNEGDARARATITVSGSPETPEPARGSGFSIERSYYTLDGARADPRQVAQNSRLITVITVHEGKPLGGQIMLRDNLPAGFEIDNPRLVSSGDVSSLSWLPKSAKPKHTEFRDDRFLAAFDLKRGKAQSLSVAYVVRAVAPGRYVHAGASVEDMYRPDRFAKTDAGTVEVVAAE